MLLNTCPGKNTSIAGRQSSAVSSTRKDRNKNTQRRVNDRKCLSALPASLAERLFRRDAQYKAHTIAKFASGFEGRKSTAASESVPGLARYNAVIIPASDRSMPRFRNSPKNSSGDSPRIKNHVKDRLG